eukprot:m.147723 g.147723  ORF g.147723 m.147723 type:complete len:361 (-) comp11663_c0_seq6:157-1239(-)
MSHASEVPWATSPENAQSNRVAIHNEICEGQLISCPRHTHTHSAAGVETYTDMSNEALQEWRDKVSEVVGSHLLQGYCMLAETCEVCPTGVPLMRDRAQKTMCVACNECPWRPQPTSQPATNGTDAHGTAPHTATATTMPHGTPGSLVDVARSSTNRTQLSDDDLRAALYESDSLLRVAGVDPASFATSTSSTARRTQGGGGDGGNAVRQSRTPTAASASQPTVVDEMLAATQGAVSQSGQGVSDDQMRDWIADFRASVSKDAAAGVELGAGSDTAQTTSPNVTQDPAAWLGGYQPRLNELRSTSDVVSAAANDTALTLAHSMRQASEKLAGGVPYAEAIQLLVYIDGVAAALKQVRDLL